MKKLIAFFLFSALCRMAYAQEIQIIGRILTPDSIPVAGAHIADEKSRVGTTSGENGFFILSLPVEKTALRFSHVAFYEKKVSLSESTLRKAEVDGRLWLDVVMEMRVRELPAADISDAKVQIAWEDPKQWILDYELVGKEEVLLLLLEKNKRYLQLVDNRQEKISQISLNHNYNALHKDCLGNIHLISTDSACQVFLLNETFVFAHHTVREDFDIFIIPTIIDTDNFFYTKTLSDHNQLVTYNKINKKDKSSEAFIGNIEESQLFFNQKYLNSLVAEFVMENEGIPGKIVAAFRYMLIATKDVKEMVQSISLLGPVNISYGLLASMAFFKQILEIPPFSVLAKINDSLFFFDHLNDRIQKFDLNGNYFTEKEISYHHQKGWDKEIFIDEERTRCFAKFANVGETTLRELDPNTGKFLQDIVLEQHAFPSKIKIRGNYVYYRCRDIYEGEDRYFLWKQRIE